jgi:RNA polymerase sigma-70 factor, ECF subfamily
VEFYSFDETYLQRLRQNDSETEQHFVAYFSKLILIKLRSRLQSSSAIDDIRQETFVRVLKAVRTEGGVRSAKRLGGFVNSVCNNVLQEFYRSSVRTQSSDEGPPEPPDRTIDLEGALVTKQTRQQVRDVLARLPDKDRRLLKALFIDEKEKEQVCREFGVDRDYLRVLLHRAKQSFRAAYGQTSLTGRTHVEC